MKTNGIRVHKIGGPEEMVFESLDLAAPKENEVVIRQKVIGLNFIDTYFRSGLYPAPLPTPIGMEAAGVIEELGADVNDFKVGDRVAYASRPLGSYSEARVFPTENLVKIPDDISDETAAAIMLKGMTAEYLIRRTYKVSAGQTVLFHAAAGGVGLIACQWLKALGATVIGTVGSNEKAELAKANGCEHTILYKEESFVDRVKDITNGAGVPVVYDSVGKDTALLSLDCLSPLGLLVIFGNSSGNAPPIEPGLLAAKGSLYVTRPTLFNYNDTREKLINSANSVFDVVRSGKISIKIGAKYDLKDAVQAHKDLEGRKTTGCVLLIP
ncbi:MAG: quinone oxidoreductase [Pelagibacterales bacterium]|nr:quinone oxidoreductase [Pelagibacterales bacterium]PPR16635.1 MAG: Quinone oxidoreductase 1 [Alphaproteobacteria bacterium MarineAlpha9_Bin3]|tara:strand:- start:32565 stop:33542 length:978 start_codon:yes stop_codon:yes gene_type:complete